MTYEYKDYYRSDDASGFSLIFSSCHCSNNFSPNRFLLADIHNILLKNPPFAGVKTCAILYIFK
ncbi:hypothetical protein SAMN05518672_101775 [Chitinophaga sp. CF118]|nr:hypothetical protein SAMN05518672_101775 [Chitinophaga sp. CF118]